MQRKALWIVLALFLAGDMQATAQSAPSDSIAHRWFIGTSLFMLFGNFDRENPPDFVQVDIGYRITGKDVIRVSPKTWRYAWPNGIHPFLNKAYKRPEEKFPGYVREYGVTFSYARFLWKGLYAQLDVMPAYQVFVHNDGRKTDHGFQLFNSYRVGYHIRLFNDKFFLQPSVCMTHRACHTQLPDGFKQLDDKWSKFIFPEPGLNVGFNF